MTEGYWALLQVTTTEDQMATTIPFNQDKHKARGEKAVPT